MKQRMPNAVNTIIEILATAAQNAPVYAEDADFDDLQSFDKRF